MNEEKLKITKLKHINNNLKIYEENKSLILLYEEYIQKIVELFDFLKIKQNEDMVNTIMFDILIETGFFSYDRHFDSDMHSFKELIIKLGISVVYGSGVCRNISSFYEDVFKHFYDYPLKICCLDKYGTLNKDIKIYGNHSINLTIYHDVLYGFDIMNHCLFYFKNANKLKGFDINYSLIYKSYGDILMRLTTDLEFKNDYLREINEKCLLFEIASRSKNLSKKEYKKLISDANSFIIDRKKIFQSFLTDNELLCQEIRDKVLCLK